MTLALQDFIHTFFTGKSVPGSDDTVLWAADEGTPSDYESASTEKVQAMLLKISVTFNASATGDVVIHFRKNSDTTLNTDTIRFTAPASAVAQKKEYAINGMFKDLDVGVENEDSTYAATVSISVIDGTKITGVTAAA